MHFTGVYSFTLEYNFTIYKNSIGGSGVIRNERVLLDPKPGNLRLGFHSVHPARPLTSPCLLFEGYYTYAADRLLQILIL